MEGHIYHRLPVLCGGFLTHRPVRQKYRPSDRTTWLINSYFSSKHKHGARLNPHYDVIDLEIVSVSPEAYIAAVAPIIFLVVQPRFFTVFAGFVSFSGLRFCEWAMTSGLKHIFFFEVFIPVVSVFFCTEDSCVSSFSALYSIYKVGSIVEGSLGGVGGKADPLRWTVFRKDTTKLLKLYTLLYILAVAVGNMLPLGWYASMRPETVWPGRTIVSWSCKMPYTAKTEWIWPCQGQMCQETHSITRLLRTTHHHTPSIPAWSSDGDAMIGNRL